MARSGSCGHLLCSAFRCCPGVPGVPCATFPSHRAKQPGSPSPAHVLLLCQVWCWQSPAWHSRAGTCHIRRAGATEGASGCWHWQGHSVCQCRVWHQGTAWVSCASVWHHLCIPCGKCRLEALLVVLDVLVALCWWQGPVAAGRDPAEPGQQGRCQSRARAVLVVCTGQG